MQWHCMPLDSYYGCHVLMLLLSCGCVAGSSSSSSWWQGYRIWKSARAEPYPKGACHRWCVVALSGSGVPEDERYEGDDLEVLARAEEAEEAAFGEEEVSSSRRQGPAAL